MKVTHTYGKVLITFHKIKWKNITETENTIPRIIRILKEFIVNIIKLIAIKVNPIVTKFTLNSSIIIINMFSTDFVREKLLKKSCIPLPHSRKVLGKKK